MKDKITVVKIGGNVLNEPLVMEQVLTDFIQMDGFKILVHGGGKMASTLATKLGVKTTMIDGRRVTDAETLEIATMVYAGLINKNLVAQLQAKKQLAIGLSGVDFSLLLAQKRAKGEVDYGFVGDIQKVHIEPLILLLNAGIIPVVCPLSHDGHGQLLNTNADTIAASLAKALVDDFEVELICVFDKNGVLRNSTDESSKLDTLNQKDCFVLIQKELIFEGMLPKLKNCFEAKESGVTQVRIGGVKCLLDPDPFSTLIV
ncbi:MAG: acetylglutamate kinase [Crocinitomicaceae bacterium]|jgi:acetylglutamate kinase|nr:acetylglutamate kinase [Crocinitomicaceae bacterium]